LVCQAGVLYSQLPGLNKSGSLLGNQKASDVLSREATFEWHHTGVMSCLFPTQWGLTEEQVEWDGCSALWSCSVILVTQAVYFWGCAVPDAPSIPPLLPLHLASWQQNKEYRAPKLG
jgi:hypothetical protein